MDIFIILLEPVGQVHDNQTVVVIYIDFSCFFHVPVVPFCELYSGFKLIPQTKVPCTVFCITQGLPNKSCSCLNLWVRPFFVSSFRERDGRCGAVLLWQIFKL